MATQDNVTFSQRLVESVWSSLNPNEAAQNAYDLHRALDMCLVKGNDRFHKADMGGSFVEANVSAKTMPISTQIVEGNEYNLLNIEPLQGAKWPWTTLVSPLVFTLEEISENQGKAKILDTVEYKVNEAMTDHMNVMNFEFIRGTGVAPSTESLNTLVGTSDNGGLSVATYPNWKSYVDATSQNLAISSTLDKGLDATMFTGKLAVDLIISGLTLFQRYKALGAAATTIFQPSDSRKPNANFQGTEFITFRDASWFWDRQVQDVADPNGYGDTANYLYGINTAVLHLCCMKGFYLQKMAKKDAVTQLAWHLPIVSRYQFATTSRRSHFKYSALGVS